MPFGKPQRFVEPITFMSQNKDVSKIFSTPNATFWGVFVNGVDRMQTLALGFPPNLALKIDTSFAII